VFGGAPTACMEAASFRLTIQPPVAKDLVTQKAPGRNRRLFCGTAAATVAAGTLGPIFYSDKG